MSFYNNPPDTPEIQLESVGYSPELPRSGDSVNFTVKVKSTYSTSQDVKLKLFIDGNLVDVTQGGINANSEGTFTLHWLAEKGEHYYTIKAYSIIGGQEFMDDEESGSIKVSNSENKTGVEIVSLECPSELKIPGEFWCSVVVENSLNNDIDVTARIRMDGELIDLSRTLGNTNPTLNTGKNEFRIGVNINNNLAQNEFNYNSFLDFLNSKVVTKENCGHRISNCQVFEWLPTPHNFNIEIHKNNKILDSKGTKVTLIYGNYYETKFIEYYAIPLLSGITAGTATALAEVSVSAGVSAAKVGIITSAIVELYNILKQHFGR